MGARTYMTMQLGYPRYDFDTVTSTNDFAKIGVEKGVPEGALYTARHQTRGRGRRGASWQDEAGASALMSFVLYPSFPIADAWILSFAAAVSVCDALQQFGANGVIKWPNDILLHGAKVAGVLVETARSADGRYGAVIGIGVNVGQKSFPDAEGFGIVPISLATALGSAAPPAEMVIAQVRQGLAHRYLECGSAESRQRLLRAWRERLILGQSQTGISVETGRKVRGILRDVRLEDGAALLEEPDGTFTVARPVETPDEETNRV